MPQNPIINCEIFYVLGIDFLAPFPSSYWHRYILGMVNYVSQWVDVQAIHTNDAKLFVRFLKKLFSIFGMPRAIISDRGTHFCDAQLERVLKKYSITQKVATPYHPQTSS